MSSKVKSTKTNPFVKGGSGKMFGKQASGTQKPGQSAQLGKTGGGKGGGKKMFGKQSAGPVKKS